MSFIPASILEFAFLRTQTGSGTSFVEWILEPQTDAQAARQPLRWLNLSATHGTPRQQHRRRLEPATGVQPTLRPSQRRIKMETLTRRRTPWRLALQTPRPAPRLSPTASTAVTSQTGLPSSSPPQEERRAEKHTLLQRCAVEGEAPPSMTARMSGRLAHKCLLAITTPCGPPGWQGPVSRVLRRGPAALAASLLGALKNEYRTLRDLRPSLTSRTPSLWP